MSLASTLSCCTPVAPVGPGEEERALEGALDVAPDDVVAGCAVVDGSRGDGERSPGRGSASTLSSQAYAWSRIDSIWRVSWLSLWVVKSKASMQLVARTPCGSSVVKMSLSICARRASMRRDADAGAVAQRGERRLGHDVGAARGLQVAHGDDVVLAGFEALARPQEEAWRPGIAALARASSSSQCRMRSPVSASISTRRAVAVERRSVVGAGVDPRRAGRLPAAPRRRAGAPRRRAPGRRPAGSA